MKNLGDGKDPSKDAISLNQIIVQLENLLEDKELELENSNLTNHILKYLKNSVFLHDLDEKIIYANEAVYKALRYSEDELFQMKFHELITPQHMDTIDSIIYELIENQESVYLANYLCKDGSRIPVEVRSRIVELKDEPLVLSFVKELSDGTTEKLLEDNEEKFRIIFQNSNDIISLNLVNEDGLPGKFIEINETGSKKLGYTKEELLNMGPLDVVAPESKADMFKNTAELFERSHNTYEILYRTKTGKIMPIEVNNHLIKYNGHEVCLTVSRDISEYRKAEEALITSEIKYRTIFEHTGTATTVIEEDTTLSLVNSEFEKLSGFKKEELEGKKSWRDFVFEDDLDILQEYQVLRRMDPKLAPENYEFRFVDKNKHVKNILANVIMFPGTKKSLASLLDITQLKKNEIAIEEQYNFLQYLMDTIPYPFFYKDANYIYMGCNKIFEEFIGLSKDEIIGKTVYDISPKDLADTYHKKDKDLIENGPLQAYEAEVRYADGSRHTVIFNKSTFDDLDGNVAGLIGIMVDITDRKKAEEELKHSHDNLELTVKERTQELEEMIKEFKRSNAELKEFAHVASHDLREPLRMITTFLQLLEKRYKDQLDEDANEFIGFAVNGAKRLDEKIKDLLEYSQVKRKDRKYGLIDCETVMDETLIYLKVPMEESEAIITHDPLPVIHGDEKLMIQLFQNIIGNAIKYRSEDKPEIHISAKFEGDHYLFSIEDNGIGIDSKHLERIFTIFKRLHTEEEYEGTGIGLAIAQKIVHQFKGEIWAESKLGVGSTFYFTIPRK